MAVTERREPERGSKSHKSGPSSDRGLQLDLLKPELLVIAGQPYCGEYVLKSCTRVAMRSEELVGESPISIIHNIDKRNPRSDS